MNENRFLITQSLLSSYGWIFKKENGYDDFLKALYRKKSRQTKAMLDGIHFENLVTEYCNGNPPEGGHKWENGVKGVGIIVKNGAFQVKAARNVTVNGVQFILYGILDVLRGGEIFDIKFSKTYSYGKYLDSPQHPMYLALCPEAVSFTYLISDGKDVCKEPYRRENVSPIENEIAEFMQFLDERNLVGVYVDKWRSKY